MEEILLAFLSMLLVVSLISLYLWKRRHDSRSPSNHDQTHQEPRQEALVRATGTRRMRRRPAASDASSSSSSAAPTTVDETVEESDDEAGGGEYYGAKASKKKKKKRQEREARRQAEEAVRETRQTKQDHYAEMRRKNDEEREAEERRLEEEAKAQKVREEEAAALEFEKWKGEFSVDDEGTMEEAQDANKDLLADFVDYIKKHKCIPLEDLAVEFKLRTQECVNRITSLENMGRLSGVMDDRGKYIYISLEEMQAVADYIKRQGRVSISHLASKSNQFIDLEPKSQHVEDITTVDEIIAN